MSQLVGGSSSRILSIDAARGVAMILVCVAHFSDIYFYAPRPGPVELPQLGTWEIPLGFLPRMASPIFFVLSGMIVAYLCGTRKQDARTFRLHLIDKALFIMTIGHVLIAIVTAARSTFINAMSIGYVTDTLAICTLGTISLLPHTALRSRTLLGFTTYFASWTAWYLWTPSDPILITVKSVLIGPNSGESMVFYFPLLPWFGVHLIGSSIGEYLSRFRADELYWKGGKQLFVIGTAVSISGLGIKVIVIALNAAGVFTHDPVYYPIVAPLQKYPPGPLYLMLFGGAALMLIGMLLLTERYISLGRLTWLLSSLGQNAFPAFLLQYFVYYTLFYLLVTQTTFVTTWVAFGFLILSILGLVATITWLNRYHISRTWTVGLAAPTRP